MTLPPEDWMPQDWPPALHDILQVRGSGRTAARAAFLADVMRDAAWPAGAEGLALTIPPRTALILAPVAGE